MGVFFNHRLRRAPLIAAGLLPALLLAGHTQGASPAPAPPVVEIAGCSAFTREAVCLLGGARTLTLWVKAPANEIAVTAGGEPASLSGAAISIQEGTQLHVLVPASDGELGVTTAHGATISGTWRMPLQYVKAIAPVEEAERLRKQGLIEQARSALAITTGDPSPVVRALAGGVVARLGGQSLEAAIALDRAAGVVSAEVRDRAALGYARLREWRFDEAEGALDALRALSSDYDAGRAMAPYYEELVPHQTGDLRSALRLVREAIDATERLDLPEHDAALVMFGDLLHRLGRADDIVASLPAIAAAADRSADRAEALNNLGMLMLYAREAPGDRARAVEDPIPVLEKSCALYQQAGGDPRKLAAAMTSLAQARRDAGDLEGALAKITEAERLVPALAPSLRARWTEIEAGVALARSELDRAVKLYDRLAALGRSGLLPYDELAGTLGKANALEKLGRLDDAAQAYAEADRLLDDRRQEIPLGEGRDVFLGRNDRAARERIDLLLRRGKAEEAAGVARRSRARALAALHWVSRIESLDADRRDLWRRGVAAYGRERDALDDAQRDDWKTPLNRQAGVARARENQRKEIEASMDELLWILSPPDADAAEAPLPPPAPGEAILVFHPVRDGWAGFSQSAEGVLAFRLAPFTGHESKAELGEALLKPFADVIARASRLRILAYGALDTIDFQSLPLDGEPLLAHLPVAYGIDVPAPAIRGDSAEPHVLVVADPRSDLPAAREEALSVARQLEARGLWVQLLAGPEATHRTVHEALERGVTIFHYAGHGVVAGRDGLKSGLPLAGGEPLTVGDVLALAHPPEQVVLSACDGARSSEGAQAEGLGVAQAFLLTGSRFVVAAAGPVDDHLPGPLMTSFYDALPDGGDPAAALRRAELEVRATAPSDSWSTFRLLAP